MTDQPAYLSIVLPGLARWDYAITSSANRIGRWRYCQIAACISHPRRHDKST